VSENNGVENDSVTWRFSALNCGDACVSSLSFFAISVFDESAERLLKKRINDIFTGVRFRASRITSKKRRILSWRALTQRRSSASAGICSAHAHRQYHHS